MRIATAEELARAAAIFRGRRCVVERGLISSCELSVICARTRRGRPGRSPPPRTSTRTTSWTFRSCPPGSPAPSRPRRGTVAVRVRQARGRGPPRGRDVPRARTGGSSSTSWRRGRTIPATGRSTRGDEPVRAARARRLRPAPRAGGRAQSRGHGEHPRRRVDGPPGRPRLDGGPLRAPGQAPPLREARAAPRPQDGALHGAGRRPWRTRSPSPGQSRQGSEGHFGSRYRFTAVHL
jgi:hypothetical protein